MLEISTSKGITYRYAKRKIAQSSSRGPEKASCCLDDTVYHCIQKNQKVRIFEEAHDRDPSNKL